MPDPQRDIAPIIEPVPPVKVPVGHDHALPIAIAFGVLLLLAVLAWHWHRYAPLRELRRLARAPDPVDAAGALARLVTRLPFSPPADWLDELERLRFGPPVENASMVFARLCMQAETFLKSR